MSGFGLVNTTPTVPSFDATADGRSFIEVRGPFSRMNAGRHSSGQLGICLKGEPAPDWIEKGVPYLERERTALSTLGPGPGQ
jgi:hypothetical protein